MPIGVDAVALLEARDGLPDGSDRARPVKTNHVGERRLGAVHLAEQFAEAALALPWVPRAHANGFDPDQNLFGANLRHGERLQPEFVDATELVDRGGLHRGDYCRSHRVLL